MNRISPFTRPRSYGCTSTTPTSMGRRSRDCQWRTTSASSDCPGGAKSESSVNGSVQPTGPTFGFPSVRLRPLARRRGTDLRRSDAPNNNRIVGNAWPLRHGHCSRPGAGRPRSEESLPCAATSPRVRHRRVVQPDCPPGFALPVRSGIPRRPDCVTGTSRAVVLPNGSPISDRTSTQAPPLRLVGVQTEDRPPFCCRGAAALLRD